MARCGPFVYHPAKRRGSYAGAHFSSKAPGDLRYDDQEDAALTGDAGATGVAGNGVVGESMCNSCETISVKSEHSSPFCGFAF